jgi:hypothetical protein
MHPARFDWKLPALVIVAIGAIILLLTQRSANQTLRAENDRLVQGLQQITNAPAAAPDPQVTDAELAQLRKDAAEVHRLRAQVSALSKGQAAAPKNPAAQAPRSAPNLDDDAKSPMKRHQLGQKLAREGKFPEALQHYLWCYDEGAKEDMSFVGVRSSFLLNSIQELAAKYPPAREALVSRRDALEASVINNQSVNPLNIFDLIALNRHLDDSNRNLTLFDQLPENHPARANLVEYAGEQFVAAKRYQDMVASGNPEAAFDIAVLGASAGKLAGIKDDTLDALTRRNAVQAGGRGLEALAGAGQIDRAIAFTDKILKFDSSPETKGELLKVAERINSPQLIEHLRAK